MTRQLAERLAKVNPERFKFWNEPDDKFCLAYFLYGGNRVELVHTHFAVEPESISYAAAYCLSEMRERWESIRVFAGDQLSDDQRKQKWFLRIELFDRPISDLDDELIFQTYCEWIETFGDVKG